MRLALVFVLANLAGSQSSVPTNSERLAPTNAYRGLVVDEHGAPVARAEVVLGVDCTDSPDWADFQVRLAPERERRATTNSEGRFELDDLEARSCYSLLVRHPNFALLSTETQAVGPIGVFESFEPIVLRTGARISGFVRDEEGEAIAGASLQLDELRTRFGGEQPSERIATKTALDGGFVFEHAGSGSRWMTVRAPGFATREFVVRDLVDGSARIQDVVLPVEALLRGIVREPSGAPIAGALVRAIANGEEPYRHEGSRSNDRGEFMLEALVAGTYRVQAFAPGWAFEPDVRARTDGGELWIEGFRTPRVRGRVVRDSTGEPLSEFTVALRISYPQSSGLKRVLGSARRVERAVDGQFELLDLYRTGDSRFVIEANSPGHAPSFSAPFAVGDVDDIEGVEVRMRAGGAIRGRVVDTDGRPVFGAFVRACMPEKRGFGCGYSVREAWLQRRATQTNEAGEFLLEHLSSQPHTLLVDTVHRLPRKLPSVLVSDDRTNVVGDVVLQRGALLRGRVVDRSGKGCDAPHVLLETWSQDQIEPLWVECDAQGAFELHAVPPGECRIRVVCGSSPWRTLQGTTTGRFLEIEEGEAVLDVVLHVDP